MITVVSPVYYIMRAVACDGSAGIETQINRIRTIPSSRGFYAAVPVIRKKTFAFHTFYIHFRLFFAAFRFDKDWTTIRRIIALSEKRKTFKTSHLIIFFLFLQTQ